MAKFEQVLLVAGEATRDGLVYPAEALKKLAEAQPERLRFDGERLWCEMEVASMAEGRRYSMGVLKRLERSQ